MPTRGSRHADRAARCSSPVFEAGEPAACAHAESPGNPLPITYAERIIPSAGRQSERRTGGV